MIVSSPLMEDCESFSTVASLSQDDTVATKHTPSSATGTGSAGMPVDPPDAEDRKSVLINVSGFIIVTEFCERLAFYGFAGSLVLFFQKELSFTNANSDNQYSYWSAMCYLTPLLGGFVADTYLNRYNTILLFCIIYVIGLVVVELSIIPGKVNPGTFFLGMYIIALGTGGIKPNVSTLGADQFDERYSKDRREKESFFNWFYWSINAGALISYSVVAYICQYGIASLGGLDYAFIDGYAIPTIMMGLAIVIFVSGTRRYTIHRPQGSVITTAVKICWEAIVTQRNAPKPASGLYIDKAYTVNGGSYSLSAVEGVKAVVRLLPFLVAMVPYWGVYSQMSSVFQNQGCQMDLSLGAIEMPVSALNVFDTIAILVLVPVFDRVVYPFFKDRLNLPLTMLVKIGLGFFFALLAMVAAATVEVYRLHASPAPGNYTSSPTAVDNITPCQNIDDYNPYQYQAWAAGLGTVTQQPAYCQQICSDTFFSTSSNVNLLSLSCISCQDIPQMSSLSIFYQVPQFVLVGISEILASITSLEFFYSQAPVAMRSVSQALNLFTTSLGSLMIVPIVLLVNVNPNKEWLPSNLDTGHVAWYFLVLALIMLLDMFYFYWISKSYVYKTTAELIFNDDGEGEGDGDSSGAEESPLRPVTTPAGAGNHSGNNSVSSGSSSSVSTSSSSAAHNKNYSHHNSSHSINNSSAYNSSKAGWMSTSDAMDSTKMSLLDDVSSHSSYESPQRSPITDIRASGVPSVNNK